MTALETEHKHLVTKADLEKGLRATEARLSKQIQGVQEAMWRLPIVILGGVAILMTIAGGLAGFFAWLLG